jgi:hypothetical protein
VVVGTTTVHRQLFGEDTGMVNQYIPTDSESIKVGNITEKLNGDKQ